jgi:chemotaxis signal transduction protein
MTVGAAVTPSVAAPERRGLLFRSADRTFAIDLRDALEIVTDVQFTALAIPQGPVAGDLILRSRVLAAIDPLTLLGVPDRTGAAFAIVTASGSGDVAVLAASILGVRALPVSSSAADDGHVPGRRYLAFVRGPERFAVDAMAVGRICHAARAFRIPVTGRTRIREVIEVGSQVLPIVELPAPAASDASLVLTLEAAGGPIAIRCDRIEGLIDIAAADVKRTPLADGRTLRTVRSGTTVYQLIGGEAAAGLLAVGGGVG